MTLVPILPVLESDAAAGVGLVVGFTTILSEDVAGDPQFRGALQTGPGTTGAGTGLTAIAMDAEAIEPAESAN